MKTKSEIDQFVREELEVIARDGSGWEIFYRRTSDGTFWRLWYPNSEHHGGGSPAIEKISELPTRAVRVAQE